MKKVKDFFATPKKAVITSVCLVGGLGVLTAGSVAVTASVAKNNSIGNIAAEDIALKDAGIDYSQARIHRTEFDYDNGQYLYEVEFSSNGVEYDYRIKASDGTILWRDSEPMDGYVANVNGNQTQGEAQQQAPQLSAEQQQAQETLAQAQETLAQAQQQQQQAQEAAQQAQEAQKQAQEAAAQAQQQQQQAQQQQQQAEEAKKQAEAAQKQAQQQQQQQQQAQQQQQQPTPAQQQQSAPQQPTPAPQQPAQNNNYISVDQAKNIALGQAGFSASSVNFVKTKLENDDGRTEYEIEFYNGTTEYSYTIDAVTGSVLEYDVESIYD